MYKGNIFEFVEKLNYFLKDNGHQRELYIRPNPVGSYNSEAPYILWWGYRNGTSSGEYFYDTEDFEEKVYDFVKRKLQK